VLRCGLLLATASLYAVAALPTAAENVTVTVHADQAMGGYQPVWNYFGADEPNYLYSPEGKKLLGELSALSPVPVYFRMHNLLTTGNGQGSLKWGSTNAYTESPNGAPVYDWTITDRIFDTLKQAHVRPLVEIGFMPEALSTHPQPYRHDFPKNPDVFTGWSYPPRDYGKWSALVTAWAEHLHQRYGDAVNDWLWEVWNEPDIAYWHGTPEEYFRLYDVTTSAVLKALPHARIGGPDSTGPANPHAAAFLRQFLDHCAHGRNAATGKPGAPLDFISFHPKGRTKMVNGHVQMDVGAQLRSVDAGMRIVGSYPEWRDEPIVLGESDPEGCGACASPQNDYRDGPLYGVSVAEAVMRTYELARARNVHLQGAVTWAFTFPGQPYFPGLRQLATNGIDLPVLNVFRVLGMLGGEWVRVDSSGALPVSSLLQGPPGASPDIDAAATRGPHELDVMLWNYDDEDVAAAPAVIDLQIAGTTGKNPSAQEFLVDASHSNAFAAWKKMGSPQQPSPEQVRALERSARLQTVPAPPLAGKNAGTRSMTVTLPRQGVALVRVRWQ
jgi:xylan 1,4-beta-xylosidase